MQQFVHVQKSLPLGRKSLGLPLTRRPRLAITCFAGLVVALIVLVNLSSSSRANVEPEKVVSVQNTQTTTMEADVLPSIISAVTPNDDPGTKRLLQDSMAKVTDLINSYRRNGLSNMPNLPNLPGLNTIMRVPDKLLRAELSMLQDEIRMAQDMMQNPMSATMNAPRDLATMLQRMAQQLEQ